MSGYSIEIGDTTYNNTLEERIQAARAASSAAKQAQNHKGKFNVSSKNIMNSGSNTHLKNMTIKKLANASELKYKGRQRWLTLKSDFVPAPIITSINSFKNKNTNTNLPTNYNSTSFKSTCKGGVMQRRLETIKANKNCSNVTSFKSNVSNTLEPINASKSICPQASTKHNQFYSKNSSKHNEYKLRSTVPKHVHISEIGHKKLDENDAKNLSNASNCSNNLVATSVQYRLIKAKEEMKAKSNLSKQKEVSKTEFAEKLPVSELNSRLQTTPTVVNNKRIKRLTPTNESTKRKIPISTVKKIKSDKSNLNQIIDNKKLITLQQTPIVPKLNLSTDSETIVSPNLKHLDILKTTKQKELDSFSFVLPSNNFSVQQRLEKKKIDPDNYSNTQLNNDDSMEWEDVETNTIINTVNDLRKTTHDYEPMEWVPDTVMHSDGINYCLVVDTNILLLDLQSISIAIDRFFPEYGYLTFVLPWQVFQELDYIKKHDEQLGFRARKATRWILDKLSNKHPRIKGQPMTTKEGESNDDAILKCAICIKERVNHVNLITDDQILSIKSEVTGIPAKNSTWLKNLVSSTGHGKSGIFQEAVKKYPTVSSDLLMEFEPHLEHIIARVLKFAVGRNTTFSTFANKSWWKMYSLTPPLNLSKLLLKLKEHWQIIEPDNWFNGPTKHIEWLQFFFMDLQHISSEISLSWNELYEFLKCCTEIIKALPNEYYHITDVLLNDLMNARKRLKRILSGSVLDESTPVPQLNNLNVSNVNIPNVENILLNILEKVEQFCLCVYQVKGFHHTSTEKKNNDIPKKQIDFNKTVENYCYKLSNIINIMLKIKQFETEQILESHIIIEQFLKAIVDFDNEKCYKLQKGNLVDYCLLKDKNSFLNTLVCFQNNLAAMTNLVNIIAKP